MNTMLTIPMQIEAENTSLPSNFQPGENDVICSRGRRAYNHAGNRNFRQVIDRYIEQYTRTQSRAEKSILIMSVVDSIRRRSPNGGFVRFCKKSNCYFEIGDRRAREKVGHSFREAFSNCRDAGAFSSGECKDATSRRKSSWSENTELICDKPLPTTAPQQISLLETFAGEFNIDHRRDCSYSNLSALDMGSSEFLTNPRNKENDFELFIDDFVHSESTFDY